MTVQQHIQHNKELAATISKVLDIQKDVSDPEGLQETLEQLRALLGTSAELAAKCEYFYNVERRALYEDGVAKKSDSTGYIDAYIADAAYWKNYTENLQRNLKVSIDALRTQVSFLKNERDNTGTI